MQKKETEKPSVHQLKDSPVPPVKGAVVDQEDVRLWPENGLSKHHPTPVQKTTLDGWL